MESLGAGEGDAEGGFGAGVVEVGDVVGLPGLREGEFGSCEDRFGVVDGVLFLQTEGGNGEGEAAAGVPVEAAVVGPGGLGLEVGVADGGGV